MLTLDTVGRISGVMEYDPGGLVNRATYWDDMTNTPHQWCWWVGYGMKVASGGLAPLRSQLRARMPRVDQSTNSCVGQFKLSAAGVWTQEPNNHWECGPKSHTVMPWVSMADNDLVALKYCSWDGAPVNPQPLGISVEGFEYRKFEEGATPYIVPLRFPGQYFDEETEFHENWNRYYDASTGRYLSPEPLLQSPTWVANELRSGHQVPTYAYARNNPVRFTDPKGLFTIDTDSLKQCGAGARWNYVYDVGMEIAKMPRCSAWFQRNFGYDIVHAFSMQGNTRLVFSPKGTLGDSAGYEKGTVFIDCDVYRRKPVLEVVRYLIHELGHDAFRKSRNSCSAVSKNEEEDLIQEGERECSGARGTYSP
ncbi:MAG: RHS repeat-associated core domain-containing protein [Myxococcaceae bacterium]|nr:RHS repeat-associated core domain-containing protein [Myxococcaceae bacterium]